MNDNYTLTAESVTEGHPDKLCDTIADRVLDACLRNDPNSRVACEVLATSGKILVAGEITTIEMPDIPHIVCKTVRETGYNSDYEVEVITHDQSMDIVSAVGHTMAIGAGDQGIMYGYACHETKELLPLPVVLAHRITKRLTVVRCSGRLSFLRPDGKAQVSVEYRDGQPYRVAAVVVSCQHEAEISMDELRNAVREQVLDPVFSDFPLNDATKILINPSGKFVLGGFDADTGLTGRKLMVDTYGGLVPHGGGAFSGKDGTKVDRSGAYMARYIAKNIVFAGLAKECTVTLAYAIGKAEPVAVELDTHGTGRYPDSVIKKSLPVVFDLTPTGMMMILRLNEPIFANFCNYGHFTHKSAPWEQTDCADLLWEVCAMAAEERV